MIPDRSSSTARRWALLLGCLLVAGCAPSPKPEKKPAGETVATPQANEDRSNQQPMPSDATAAAGDASAAANPADQDQAPVEEATSLIPRKVLFGNPDKAAAKISPDGKHLSYLAPVDGVLNVWVGPVDDPAAAEPVTKDTLRGIRSYFWAYTSRHVLYVQDVGGDEDWHVYSVDLATKQTQDLTPLAKIAAQIEGVSEKFPEEILIGLNDRDEQHHDIHRVNIVSGARELVQQNPDFVGFVTDDDYRVRFASRMLPDGGNQIYKPDGQGGWTEYLKIAQEDTLTTNLAGFDKTGQKLYLLDSRGRDTGALKVVDLATDREELIAEDPRVDVHGLLVHPTEKTIQAVAFEYLRTEWKILDPQVAEDFAFLATVADGEVNVASRTQDDAQWIVAFIMDNGPVRYYRYDRAAKQARFLFTNRRALEDLPLAKMQPREIPSRDGLTLTAYLTLPRESDPDRDGQPSQPLPLVLAVHGGPWARDGWGFDPEHQLYADRGYAVLSVNFRGSTGFGKKFLNAGNKQWGRQMHDDLVDAVDWAIERRIADPAKVAIMGGSYGGYATLVGLTMTPEKFACGVDIVGPSNLVTLLKTIPPYWAPMLQMFKDRVGDPDTPEGLALLTERSPLSYVEQIARPLLIAQGANDPRVKQAEADQIVSAMQAKKIPVTYVLFPDEGHGFARPANSLAFNAVAEAFLARHLGGSYEPIGEAFEGSSITVPTGADGVPGLAEKVKSQKEE